MIFYSLHSTKLEPYMMELIANALDKSCSKLNTIEFVHCGIGDAGLKAFTKNLTAESFQHLKHLVLINNLLSEKTIALDVLPAIRDENVFWSL